MPATYAGGTQCGSGQTGIGDTVTVGTGTSATSFGSSVSVGDIIACLIGWDGQTFTVSSVTNTGSATITFSAVASSLVTHTSGAGRCQWWVGRVTGAGTMIPQAVLSSNDFGLSITAVAITGGATSSFVDTVFSTDNAEAGAPVDGPALTPSNSGACILGGVVGTNASVDTVAPSGAWGATERVEIFGDSSGFQTNEIATLDQSSAASVTPTWTASGTGNCMVSCIVIVPAAGGGRTTKNKRSSRGTLRVQRVA